MTFGKTLVFMQIRMPGWDDEQSDSKSMKILRFLLSMSDGISTRVSLQLDKILFFSLKKNGLYYLRHVHGAVIV